MKTGGATLEIRDGNIEHQERQARAHAFQPDPQVRNLGSARKNNLADDAKVEPYRS